MSFSLRLSAVLPSLHLKMLGRGKIFSPPLDTVIFVFFLVLKYRKVLATDCYFHLSCIQEEIVYVRRCNAKL